MFFWKERKRTERSFEKNGKERKERNVLLKRTEKNAKNGTFFWKERMPNPATQAGAMVLPLAKIEDLVDVQVLLSG